MAAKEIETVEALFQESIDWVRSGRIRKALSTLFRLFSLDPGHTEALEAAARIMLQFNDIPGSGLLKALAGDPKNPDLLYKTGYHFINMSRPDVARAFLESCLRMVGNHAEVLYELAYCNYVDGKNSRAIVMLKKALKDLSPERAAAAEILMIECLLYADRPEEGVEVLKRAGDELRAWGYDNTLNALELMYARYQQVPRDEPKDLRTWHFIQHGGVLLAQSQKKNSRGRFDRLTMNALAVGAILRLLQAVLEGLEIEPEAILHVDGDSYPLALATGSLLNRPTRHWKNRSGHNEMLVIPDMRELEEKGLRPGNREECAFLFCFHLFPLQEHFLLPDMVGVMAHHFLFPWQERVELIHGEQEELRARNVPSDARDPEVIGSELGDAARMLPEDKRAPKLIRFYRRHKDLLFLTNRDLFQERRMYTPTTPA